MSIKPFFEKLQTFKQIQELKDKFKSYPTVTEQRIYGKSEKYEVPIHEISIWIENGWKFDEVQNKMYKKGRESVNVQQSKVNHL